MFREMRRKNKWFPLMDVLKKNGSDSCFSEPFFLGFLYYFWGHPITIYFSFFCFDRLHF